MLNVKVRNGNAQIIAAGDLKELAADITCVVSDVYGQLLENDSDCAYAFRGAMIHAIADPNSQVWTTADGPQMDSAFAHLSRRIESEVV